VTVGRVTVSRVAARRWGVAVGYTAVFAVTTAVYLSRSAATRRAWSAWTSTNLVNLRHHPVAAMVTSGLFSDGDLVAWTVLALVGLGVVNWSLGNWRTALLVVAAHVGGTLVSQGILAYRIASGAAPDGDRLLIDVGPSYVVACALVAGALWGAGWSRLAAAIGFALLAPSLFGGLPGLDVAAVGHVCAVLTAVVLGWPLWRAARRRVGIADPNFRAPGPSVGAKPAS
jgi:hypothetical protein